MGRTPDTGCDGARPAHVFWFETAFDRQRSSGRIRNERLWKCETRWRYSPLTFAAVMIGVQRAISLLTSTASGCLPRAALGGISAPRASRRLRTLGSSNALWTASLSVSRTDCGVPLGANSANQGAA